MRLLFPIFALFTIGSASAQAPDTRPADGRAERLEQARQLHEQAAGIRAEADQRLAEAQTACWKKYLVNACLGDAKDVHREAAQKARELDFKAREIERQVKHEEFAEREAKRLADAPAKEAAAAARAEKNRKAAEEAQLKVERKQAEAAAREVTQEAK